MSADPDVFIRIGVDDTAIPAPVRRTTEAISAIGKAGEVSARQTAAAMRQLPMQLTDVATSLAGGQNPLLVLLQQGGQVKDSFGGIGPALRGVAAAISPTAVAVAGLGAGIGVLALAAYKGAEQDEALRDSIALTGGAAGLTSARLAALSDSVAANSQQTIGGARELVLALSSSGQVSGRVLGSTAQAVARVADVSGQSSTKVAADFATMAGGVARWAAEHNKTWNFITVEQYKYIKRLEDQGQAEKAMIFTSQQVVKALEGQQANLGTLERGWSAVGKAASSAWDSMLGLGRAATVEDRIATATQELTGLQGQLANNRAIGRGDAVIDGLGSQNAGLEAQIKALQRRLLNLVNERDNAELGAAAASDKAARERRAIAEQRDKEGKAPEFPFGAIRDARQQYRADFLRSEKALYDDLAKQDKAALEAGLKDPLGDFMSEQVLPASQRRDEQRLTQNAAFLQNMIDANARAAIELIQDERTRGEALIALDRDIARRRLRERGLEGAAAAEGNALADEEALIARRRLEVGLRASADKLAADAGQATYNDVRGALQAAFQDTQNPVKAFAQALGNAVFTRLTTSIADAMATAAVGKDGTGGLLGALLGLGKYAGSSTNVSAPNYENSFDLMNTAPPLATGTNYVPKNMLAYIHEGEAVVPKRFNPAAGGTAPGGAAPVAISNSYHVDSRTDRDDIVRMMHQSATQTAEAIFSELRARGVMA